MVVDRCATPLLAATVAHLCAMAPEPQRNPAAHRDANCPSRAVPRPHWATRHAAPVAAEHAGSAGRVSGRVLARSEYEEDCPCANGSTRSIGECPRYARRMCTDMSDAQTSVSSARSLCSVRLQCDMPRRAHRMCTTRNAASQSRDSQCKRTRAVHVRRTLTLCRASTDSLCEHMVWEPSRGRDTCEPR